MSAVMKEDKLKALVAELAKDNKALGAQTQQLVKHTVETVLNAEPVVAAATVATAPRPNI